MENQQLHFASFGQRALARIIDVVIVGIIATLITLIIVSNSESKLPRHEQDLENLARLFSILIFFLIYQPLLESTGGTWGKKIVGLRTINLKSGEKPKLINSFGRSIINFFLFILFVIPSMIGNLATLWSNKKQTWHDSLSNIAVITD